MNSQKFLTELEFFLGEGVFDDSRAGQVAIYFKTFRLTEMNAFIQAIKIPLNNVSFVSEILNGQPTTVMILSQFDLED